MKKIILSLAIAMSSYCSYAQWNRDTNTGAISPTTITDKVGIGTTSPDVPLQIGNYLANQTLTLAAGSAGASIIRFNALNNTQGNFISSTDVNSQFGSSLIQFGRRWNTDAVPTVTFNLGAGYVGIGTASPSLPLHVNGTIYSAAPASNTVGVGTSWTNNANYNFVGYQGYWGFRTATNTSYNLDVYNNGNPLTALTVLQGGNVGIGTATPDAKLAVKGTIHTQEVKVDMNGWSDFVFDKAYRIPTLSSVKTYINQNHHLPEIPSEADVIKNSVNIGEMLKLQTKKIEELTLYAIQQKEENEVLKKKNTLLERRMAAIEAALSKLTGK